MTEEEYEKLDGTTLDAVIIYLSCVVSLVAIILWLIS